MFRNKLFLRKVVAIAICLAGSITINAQDIIILRDGDDIQAVVQEVGVDDVTFKRFDNQNGPNYRLNKADIFMIRYENGSKDVFEVAAPNPTKRQQQTIGNQPMRPYNGGLYSQQQLPVLKYTFGKEISPYGSEKSPFLAGFLSFLIPGVGQFYNGDVGGGLVFMGCNIICNSVWMNAIETNYYGDVYVNEMSFTVGLMGALIVNISSIVNAAQGAKKVNIARGYRLGDNTYLKVQPTMIQHNSLLNNKEYAYGMNFCLTF